MSSSDPSGGDTSSLRTDLRWVIQTRWVACIVVLVAAGVTASASPKPGAFVAGLAMAVGVLLYNCALWLGLRSRLEARPDDRLLRAVLWVQVGLDLVCLTVALVLTGGIAGPIPGFLVLIAVLNCLLFERSGAYAVGGATVALVLFGLWLGGEWPGSGGIAQSDFLHWGGWAVILLLAVVVTTRVRAKLAERDAAVSMQGEQLQAILDTAVEGIITIDPRGRMMSVNPAAERIFGYAPGELVGRAVNVLMPEPHRSNHDSYLAAYEQTRVAKIIGIGREVVGRRKDGSPVPLDLSISEVRLGRTVFYTGIVRDVTERKQAEEELLAVNRELQRHQQALIQGEKMVAMGQMAAGIVHEIGNPLASMDSLLQLVQRHPSRLTEETAALLREQVVRIQRIVGQLTDFAHPNETAWEVYPVNDLVERTLDMMRFDRRLKTASVERRLDPEAGAARMMPYAVQQVLVNMIANAVDAMADSPQRHLEVATGRRDGACTIEISDTGHGIAPEHLPHVFEPFFTTKPIGHGTGLGLSISYAVLKRHGGDCEIESTVGKGTTFRVLLPRVAPAAEGPGSQPRGATPPKIP